MLLLAVFGLTFCFICSLLRSLESGEGGQRDGILCIGRSVLGHYKVRMEDIPPGEGRQVCACVYMWELHAQLAGAGELGKNTLVGWAGRIDGVRKSNRRSHSGFLRSMAQGNGRGLGLHSIAVLWVVGLSHTYYTWHYVHIYHKRLWMEGLFDCIVPD